MEYEGKILGVDGKKIMFELNEDFDIEQAKRLSVDGSPKAFIRMIDERNITFAQNGMIHGLFNDIALHTGYPPAFTKDLLKAMFAAVKGIEEFSMSGYQVSQVFAGEFIEYILEFCFQNEIPFKYQDYHMASDITRVLFLYVKYRQCFVCGAKQSDIHHATNLVGMGNNRKTHNHLDSRFMCLCRTHHNEVHNLGLKEFMNKYHLIPIKVNEATLVDLNITTNKEVERHAAKRSSQNNK